MGSKGHIWVQNRPPTEPNFQVPLVDANSGLLSLSADGSANWPRTLRLTEFACRDHVQRAIVTTDPSCLEVMQRRMPQFAGLLAQHQLSIKVAPAIELSMSTDMFDQAIHASTVLGGPLRRYVYLRVPSDTRLPIIPVIESLQQMKLKTVLLAPERSLRFRENESELRQIVKCGGLIQLSAASLLDQTDRVRMRFCRHLIRKQLCHWVATESGIHHDLPVSLHEAYRQVLRWAGSAVADALCCHNPASVFDGERIEATPAKSRSIMSLFSRAA